MPQDQGSRLGVIIDAYFPLFGAEIETFGDGMRDYCWDQGHVRAFGPFGTVQCGGLTPHCTYFFQCSSKSDAATELAAR